MHPRDTSTSSLRGTNPKWGTTVPADGVDAALFGQQVGQPMPAATALPAAAVTLLIGATLLALGLAARYDSSGVWALLILLTPIGILALNPLGAMLDNASPGRPVVPMWSSMAAAGVLVAAVGPALLLLALAPTGRRSAGGRSLPAEATHCPTCGAPSNSA
ncbi:hypothetical protein [Dactylosporangium salmoneum]|uniref:Integral membrane protein n=1 Tax=Dactylosporangium salmoneum TaxID=53361 RepID=A0ABN3FWE5_9ACTN